MDASNCQLPLGAVICEHFSAVCEWRDGNCWYDGYFTQTCRVDGDCPERMVCRNVSVNVGGFCIQACTAAADCLFCGQICVGPLDGIDPSYLGTCGWPNPEIAWGPICAADCECAEGRRCFPYSSTEKRCRYGFDGPMGVCDSGTGDVVGVAVTCPCTGGTCVPSASEGCCVAPDGRIVMDSSDPVCGGR